MTKKEEYKLPENVIRYVEGTITYPSIIETDFYLIEALNKMTENNKIIWSIKHFGDRGIQLKEGLIKFTDSLTYLYFKKRKDENTYKFYVLCEESSTDSVVFFLNSYKKFKTI